MQVLDHLHGARVTVSESGVNKSARTNHSFSGGGGSLHRTPFLLRAIAPAMVGRL